MIDVVLPEMRFAYASALMEMHRDRKRAFIDTLRWNLPSPGSWLEVDQFDNERAVYLLARSNNGSHQGSVRLLPSTQPHMLDTLFSDLCIDPVPTGDDCWEISRLVTSPPQIPGTSILKLHRLIALALLEFASLNSVRRYTLVAEAHRVPALLSIGWNVQPLGLPCWTFGQEVQALQIDADPAVLGQLRDKLQVSGSILRSAPVPRQAA